MTRKKLKAGQLSLWYEDGFLRYINCGEQEVLRMINHALRDHNWGTIPMKIEEEEIKEDNGAFQITYKATFRQEGISFALECEIKGNSDSSLSFSYKGKALTSFRRNRIGFTVLHPVEPCVGNPIRITHTDGSATDSHFPVQISPHQPFMDIKGMHWGLEKGIKASLLFEGEIFETEDQRNWTDASYKTYCTPLGLPFPVQLSKGEEVNQRIQLKVTIPENLSSTKKEDGLTAIRVDYSSPSPLPEFGVMLNTLNEPKIAQAAIQDLGVEYLRIDLDLDKEVDESSLHLSKKLGIPLELAIFSDDPDLAQLKRLTSYAGEIKRLLLFGNQVKVTPLVWLNHLPELRKAYPNVQIYGGTDAFFTELNRERVNASLLDGVCYSINPQVHAFDDQSLIETLPAQAYTVNSAKDLYPNKGINISPVSFHMRWNPNATDPDKPLRHPTQWTDERQFTLFGAFWFLISQKYLHQSGVDHACYFELSGDNGWYRQIGESAEKSPMYQLRDSLKQLKNVYPSTSSQPLLVDAMAFDQDGGISLFVVNWSNKEEKVQLPEGFMPKEMVKGSKFEWQPVSFQESSLPANSLVHFTKDRI